jgi:flagellar biosynthetic protein FliS
MLRGLGRLLNIIKKTEGHMIQNVNAYRKSFETVSKTKQVIMLYDSAISAIYQAKTSIEGGNFQERYNNLERAFLIVSGLKNCLDHNNAAEISKTLHGWYSSLEMKLLSIHNSNSIADCETCIGYLKTMREAWVEVDNQVEDSENAKNTSATNNAATNFSEKKTAVDDFAYTATSQPQYNAGFSVPTAAEIIQRASLSLSA